MTEALEDYERPAGRPTFITVLCILTFIGSGWGLISEGIKYSTAETQAAVISKVKEKANSDLQRNKNNDEGARLAKKMVNSISASPDNIRQGAMANIAAAILCLAGAFMMWKLKRTGFYLYLAGTLVGIISPFVIYGGSNIVSILSSVVIGFVGLIFVILYGVNLKYMK
jgi:ABC-type multidrug transport system permease subunit